LAAAGADTVELRRPDATGQDVAVAHEVDLTNY
jgi:hypothetical protein